MVIETLTKRCNEIASEIQRLKSDLVHLDATIRMFSDAPDVPRAKRGNVTRAVLDVLREAGEPMTTDAIAEKITNLTTQTLSFIGDATDEVLTMPSYGLANIAQKIFGEGGNDTVTGRVAADSLSGGDGNDILYGMDGNDTLTGDAGNDALYGGAGTDNLYGGTGVDSFIFTAATAYSGSDGINGLSLADGDVIDLSDLLGAYNPLTDLLTDFIQITAVGSNSILKVDADGGANGFVQVATIIGVTGLTDEIALETSGTLMTS